MIACCPWCGRQFELRSSGGSDQRFCRAACRQAFWTAARRWIGRALEAGLLSPEVLKGSQSSAHAVLGGVSGQGSLGGERAACRSV
jgi:hypothetical protein